MPPSSRGLPFASEPQAFAAARAASRREMRGFYFITAFLPQEKRDGVCAAIAFCGMIAAALSDASGARSPGIQIPGHPPDAGSADDPRLSLLRDRLNEIYENRLELPDAQFRSQEQHILRAVSLTISQYEIPQQYFLDFAIGQQMAATIARYPTWSALEKFCYHTSGSAALILGCILGLTHSDARQSIIRLGNAIGFTHILRNVKQDFSRGRIYLPLEDMARFKYSERDLVSSVVNDNFRELMKFEIDRARQMYREGADGLCWLAGDGSRFAASLIVVEQLDQLYDIETGSKLIRLLTILPRTWKLARREADDPLPEIFG
jgi:phytoene synthase